MRQLLVLTTIILATACGEPVGTVVAEIAPAGALPTVLVLSEGELITEARPNTRTGVLSLELAPGDYDLVVSAEGYLTADERHFVVTAGETTDLGRIVLFRGGTGSIAGSVIPAAAGATVSVLQFGSALGSAPTDGAGNFLLLDLPIGTYQLVVAAPGYERYVHATDLEVREAETLMLEPITLTASTSPTGSIAGIVEPFDAGAVIRASQAGVPVGSANSDESTGAFRLDGLAVGTYSLVITASGYAADRSLSNVEVRSAEVTDVGTVTLTRPTRVLAVEVLDFDSSAPVAGATLTLGDVSGTTESDGVFELADPAVGTGTLFVERPFYLPTSLNVEVPSEGRAEITVYLAATGRVEGTVTAGGSPVAGAVVTASDASASTNASGRFLLVQIRPGTHTMVAGAPGFTSEQATVRVERGRVIMQDVVLRPAGGVSGVVTNSATGGAVANAIVRIAGRAAVSGADGSYRLDGVPTGSQARVVSAPHFVSINDSVSISAGGVATANASLTPVATVTVRGRVTEARTGNAIVSVYVSVDDLYDYTDASGNYELLAVPIDATRLHASAIGHPVRNADLDLSGGGPVTVDIALLDYGAIAGRVVDSASGEGLPDEDVYCGGSATTDADGFFFVANVNPGNILCYVSSSTCYSSEFEHVEVAAGGSSSLVLLATRRADVLVHVRDAEDDSPVRDAEVRFDTRTVVTDAAGDATFECSLSGITTLTAWRSGYASGATRVLVPSTGEVDAWIDVTRAE